MTRLAVSTAICLTLAWAAPAAADWRDEVGVQLQEEQNCTLAFFSQIIIRNVNGKETIIAKAHCEDKRAFDIFRDDPNDPFTLKECGVPEKIEC